MKSEDKQKTVQVILQMLNGLNYADAKEILDAVHDRVLGSLKVILPEAEQSPCKDFPPFPSPKRMYCGCERDDEHSITSKIERLSESGLVYSEG